MSEVDGSLVIGCPAKIAEISPFAGFLPKSNSHIISLDQEYASNAHLELDHQR